MQNLVLFFQNVQNIIKVGEMLSDHFWNTFFFLHQHFLTN